MVDVNTQGLNLSSLIAPDINSMAAKNALSHVDVLHGGWPAADEALTQYSTLDPAQRLAIKVRSLLLCLPIISILFLQLVCLCPCSWPILSVDTGYALVSLDCWAK